VLPVGRLREIIIADQTELAVANRRLRGIPQSGGLGLVLERIERRQVGNEHPVEGQTQ
jgi:hypothetical protein